MESFEKIFEIIQSFFFLEFSSKFNFLFKGTSIAVLIDEVVVVGSFEDFDEPDNMSGILNFTESLDLVDGELFEFRADFEFLYFDDFDGNDLIGFLIDGSVDLSKLTFSNNIVQDVVLYFFSHLLSVKIYE